MGTYNIYKIKTGARCVCAKFESLVIISVTIRLNEQITRN